MSLLRKLLAKRSPQRRAVLVNANPVSIDAMRERLPAPVTKQLGECAESRLMLASATEMEVSAEHGQAAVSVFAPVAALEPHLICVGRELRLLLDHDFTLSWLTWLCARVSSDGSLYLELPAPSSATADSPRLRAATLAACSDVFTLEALPGDWFALGLTPGFRAEIAEHGIVAASARHFSSLALPLLEAWPEFARRYQSAHSGYVDAARFRPEFAARQFVYTLHGTSQKAHLLNWLARDIKFQGGLRVLDMGGGYGAMAVELATQGHEVTVVEIEHAKIEHIGRWLAELAGVRERVHFVAGDFDTVTSLDGGFDVVSFFGSLLYYPHEQCRALLEYCRARMTPGGVLIVHENPRDRALADSQDFEHQYMAADLDNHVRAVFGNARYFNIFDYREIDVAQAARSLIVLAAVNERG